MPMAIGALVAQPRLGALGAVAGLSFLYMPPPGSRHAMANILAAALAMTASYAVGLAGSTFPAAAPFLIGCIAAAGTRFCQVNRFAPPGPIFMVIAASIGASSPIAPSDAAYSLAFFVIGCIWSCAISIAYIASATRRRPDHSPYPKPTAIEARALSSLLTGLFVGSSVGLAAILDFQKPYWVAVTCVAVMQGTTLRASLIRNIHRVFGTIIGVGVAWLLTPFLTDIWLIAATVAILTFLVESMIVRHYALAAVFFTPLAILLAENSNSITTSAGTLIQTRLIDTIVGASIGLIGAVCMHYRQIRDLGKKDLL